jgi:hypothetical protein
MAHKSRGQGGCRYCVMIHGRKRSGRYRARGIAMCVAQENMPRCHKKAKDRGLTCEKYIAYEKEVYDRYEKARIIAEQIANSPTWIPRHQRAREVQGILQSAIQEYLLRHNLSRGE